MRMREVELGRRRETRLRLAKVTIGGRRGIHQLAVVRVWAK
jgi:hypothetical protein